MHWKLVGNAEQWIIVLVDPERNKNLRCLLDGWMPTVSYVATVYDGNLGWYAANMCCTGADAWWDSIGGKRIVSR